MIQLIKDALPLILPLLAAAIAWYANERAKRRAEEYQRREKKYRALTDALRGFYEANSDNRPLRAEFLRQLNLSWLYCSDNVIRKANAFLALLRVEARPTDAEKYRAVGELMVEIRRDLISRKIVKKTKLRPEDVLHVKAE